MPNAALKVQLNSARKFRSRVHRLRSHLLSVLLLLTSETLAAERQRSLLDLSLEELAKLPITSVTRTPKPVSAAAASIYVVTGEEIHRSGAATLPEALRLAPNLQVARVDARNYAVSARGFNNAFSNKLLVMIDGRTLYSPLFSGVFWDAQDLVLEDIERIEVISGPGATLWGANAVNGVINITTRPASATQGTLLTAGASMEEHQLVARRGGAIGAGHFRVYTKHVSHGDINDGLGAGTQTAWYRTQAGFRGDWDKADSQATLQGDVYSGRLQQAGTDDIAIEGANLLGRFKHRLGRDSDLLLQSYLDHTQRHQPGRLVDHINTWDVDLQHSVRLGRRHNLVWGGGYRHAHDNVQNGERFEFLPGHFPMNWANVFAQNDISLFRYVQMTVGLKFERNPYTDWESLPTFRVSYAPKDANNLIWGAISRSVRSPSRVDRDIFAPSDPMDGTPHSYVFAGGPNFQSEVAKVIELGYRAQPLDQLSYSLTLFYSQYDRLRTLEPESVGTASSFENRASADSYGFEFWTGWQATRHWRLGGGLVGQQMDVDLDGDSRDQIGITGFANGDPEIYWQLRSSLAVTDTLEMEGFFRRVGELGAETTRTPGYESLDLRLGWQLRPGLELSVIGQNLLNDKHAEFGAAPGYGEFRRTLYTKLLWEF